MGIGRVFSVALSGVAGQIVEIEADAGRGLPGLHLVGLPDTALNEARNRVRAAVINTGQQWPGGRITLALSPATLPKIGSVYDLGLACAVLRASGAVPAARVDRVVLLGELALDGRVRHVRGVLPSVVAARDAGFTQVVVPVEDLAEAALVDGVDALGADSLGQVVRWLKGEGALHRPAPAAPPAVAATLDLVDVAGQDQARYALEVAAAGGHHLFLTGPPGAGKTMLASRLPGLLPPLSGRDALTVTAIHSVSGLLAEDRPLVVTPPFVAPHHTASVAALIGGGAGFAKPGAVSLAHRGILFLDECGEMGGRALEALRTPIEEGEVRIARRDGVARYPARFQLVLAANPCGCAAAREQDCVCAATERRRYLGKISGALLDRVDLHVRLTAPTMASLGAEPGECTAQVRERVAAAREAAAARWGAFGWGTNGEVPGPVLRQGRALAPAAVRPLAAAVRHGEVSARGVDRTLRLAWTMADLEGAVVPGPAHVEGALEFRDRTSLAARARAGRGEAARAGRRRSA